MIYFKYKLIALYPFFFCCSPSLSASSFSPCFLLLISVEFAKPQKYQTQSGMVGSQSSRSNAYGTTLVKVPVSQNNAMACTLVFLLHAQLTGLSLQKNVDSCLEPKMAFTKTRHNKLGREDAEGLYTPRRDYRWAVAILVLLLCSKK